MNNSFYGGRDGKSFVIKKAFATIPKMVEAFAQGSSYADVKWGEYVIINTTSKNHPDNGKLFRRGMDYGDTNRNIEYYEFNAAQGQYIKAAPLGRSGGAIYIGTIVGPAGPTPHMLVESMSKIEEAYNINANKSEILKSEFTFEPGSIEFYPGATTEGDANDKLYIKAYSIRDNEDNETTVHLGFKVPYYHMDLTAAQVSSQSAFEFKTEKDLPFYNKYHINIPKGRHGMSIENIYIKTADDSVVSFFMNGDSIERNVDGTIKTPTNGYPGRDDDIGKRQIWVATVKDFYRSDSNPDIYTVYLGDYNILQDITLNETTGALTIEFEHNDSKTYNLNWIKDIAFAEDGTITLDYSSAADKTINNLIKWINNVSLSDAGEFEIKFNYGNDYVTNLKWPIAVNLSQEGVVTVGFNDGSSSEQENKLSWVTNIEMDADGTVTTSYNNQDSETKQFTWVEDIAIESDGTFVKKLNSNEEASRDEKAFTWVEDIAIEDDGTFVKKLNIDEEASRDEKAFTWMTDITIAEDGVVTHKYNNKEDEAKEQFIWIKDLTLAEDGTVTRTYNNNTTETSNVTWVDDIQLENNGQVSYTLNDGTVIEQEGDPLEWVTDVAITDAGVFTKTYNTEKSAETTQLNWLQDIVIDADGSVTKTYADSTQNSTESNKLKWVTGVAIADNGDVSVQLNDATESVNNALTWPIDIKIQNDGSIITSYNNKDDEVHDVALNWVTEAIVDENKQLTMNFINADDNFNIDLKTVNAITVESGNFYVTYNTNPEEKVLIGTVGSHTLDMVAADTQEDVDPNLRIGGLWIVTQDQETEEIE